MVKKAERIALKFDVLDFIRRQQIVAICDLMDHFGYSYKGAANMLSRLKKQNLVQGMGRGNWVKRKRF